MDHTHYTIDATHPPEIVLGQVAKTNGLKKVFLPALLAAVDTNGHIALLADGAAEAARLVARGQVSKGITQVVELAAREELRRHVVLEPEDLGDLHLNAHLAADIFEELMLGGIDFLRLLDGTMIQPENDVAVVSIVRKVRPGNGLGLVSVLGEDS